MVPTKKRISRRKSESRSVRSRQDIAVPGDTFAMATGGTLRFHDYLVMNGVFIAFCVVQLIVVRLLLRDFAGLYFFFGFLICAFAIASLFDYFSSKLKMGESAGDSIEPANDKI